MKKALIYSLILAICTSFQILRGDHPKLLLTARLDSLGGKNLSLKITLTNNTPDTLKYVSRDCSWQDSYLIDNDKWRIIRNVCKKNVLKTFLIPPYQSETKILELEKLKGFTKSKSLKFRIGFHCIPPPVELKNIPAKLEKLKNTDLTIWSNIVTPNLF